MRTNYLGATEGELRAVSGPRRLVGFADQRTLFPHAGLLQLQPQALVLGGWRSIPRSAIVGVRLTFTEAYTRMQAAGARGNSVSFGLFGSLGKPLVLDLNGDEPVYLLIGYSWLTGISQARTWLPVLQRWTSAGVAV